MTTSVVATTDILKDRVMNGPDTSLLGLGTGGGSKVESVKLASDFLRGTIAGELVSDTPALSEADANLLKFHGSYQQEDRDQRRARREGGGGKAYQFMVRTRVPGGVLSAEQYLAEDNLAQKYGNGSLRITTRQGFQHHGILKGNLRTAIAEINATKLTTLAACGDVNRNVMACPAPPQTDAEEEIQAMAGAIARRLTPHTSAYREIWLDGERIEADSEPLYGPTYLPRKFKIGVARPDDNCVDVFTQDIGLVGVVANGKLAGFTVLVGGGLGTTHGKTTTYPRLGTPLAFVTTDQILPVVEAIVALYRDNGDRTNRKHARLKYLVEERGIAWVRSEVMRRAGFPLAPPQQVTFNKINDHLGWHEQRDGRRFLGVFVANGRIVDGPLLRLSSGLRAVVQRFKPGVRLTGQQNLLLTDIPEAEAPALENELRVHGIQIDPKSLGTKRDAMACPALPTCGLALTDAERVLPDIVREIEAELGRLGIADRPLSLRMTGCPNGCARPYMGDVGFVGRSKDLYDIFLGGDWANTRLNWLYQTSIRLNDLPATLAPLLQRWRDDGRGGETFGDYCHRVGRDALLPQEEAS